MNPEPNRPPPDREDDGFDHGWEGHERRQARLGLSLTPAQRLEWLVRTMREMRAIQGRAREGSPWIVKKEPDRG